MPIKKKLLWVDHAYHIKTSSTSFISDMLEDTYDVYRYYLDPYEMLVDGEICYRDVFKKLEGNKFDTIVFFQLFPPYEELKYLKFKKIIFFPMYDGAPSRSEKIWKDYDGNVTIINFSSTLHSECIENDFNSKYIQFFQKPISFSSFGEEHGIFFWQRLTDINIYTICSLIGENNITHVHIHKAIDPSQHFVECRNLLKNKISYSEWFEYESDMLNIIEKYALYISPRMYEGIGMSFIKAMSMGRCVIAVDHPTMNEYISHGETGLLFDLSHIHDIRINEFDIRKIQKNTLEYMTEGYEKFQKNLRYIPGWIEESPVARPAKI